MGPGAAAGAVTHGSALGAVPPLLALAALAAYLGAVWAARRRGRAWPAGRTAWFALGALAVAVCVSPPVMHAAHLSLRAHMVQHLALAMLAPLALVLGAPVTAVLRALPARPARRLARVLRSRPVAVVSHPAVALALNVGGMAALYATPLFGAMHGSAWVSAAVHVHMLAAGCLFTYAVLAGPDPAPHAAPMGVRLAALAAGVAAHAVLSKQLAAQGWPAGYDAAETLAAAQVMYYGGDLAEALLLAALLAAWYRGEPGQTLGRWLPAPPGPSASETPVGAPDSDPSPPRAGAGARRPALP